MTSAYQSILDPIEMSAYTEDHRFSRMLRGDVRREVHDGHVIDVTALAETGFHTGRRRYRVVCTTCGEVVHEATTGPDHNVSRHMRDLAERSL